MYVEDIEAYRRDPASRAQLVEQRVPDVGRELESAIAASGLDRGLGEVLSPEDLAAAEAIVRKVAGENAYFHERLGTHLVMRTRGADHGPALEKKVMGETVDAGHPASASTRLATLAVYVARLVRAGLLPRRLTAEEETAAEAARFTQSRRDQGLL